MDENTCDIHDAFMLGCTGRTLLSLWIEKASAGQKVFGVFEHHVMNRKVPLVRGFDDYFMAPHSRHTEVRAEDIRKIPDLTILAESDEAGVPCNRRRRQTHFRHGTPGV